MGDAIPLLLQLKHGPLRIAALLFGLCMKGGERLHCNHILPNGVNLRF